MTKGSSVIPLIWSHKFSPGAGEGELSLLSPLLFVRAWEVRKPLLSSEETSKTYLSPGAPQNLLISKRVGLGNDAWLSGTSSIQGCADLLAKCGVLQAESLNCSEWQKMGMEAALPAWRSCNGGQQLLQLLFIKLFCQKYLYYTDNSTRDWEEFCFNP